MFKSIFKVVGFLSVAAVFCVGCGDKNDDGPDDDEGGGAKSSYTITFDPTGGTVSPTSGKTGADGRLASLPIPTRSGYTFDGWYTMKTDGTQVTTGTVFSENTVIYARWTTDGKSIIDSRDGKVYRQITVGTQKWMGENLNYDIKGSVCYDDDSANCAEYGRLYTWDAAVAACPADWRLPTDAEWDILADYAGGWETAGTKFKSKTGWKNNGNGTDVYEFSALPGGIGNRGSFTNAGDGGYWWSATETEGDPDFAWYRNMGYNLNSVDRYNSDKRALFSVRCVQDGDDKTDSTYTITFNVDGDTVSPASGTTDIDGKLTSLPTPTRNGYIFVGWYTAETGGTQVTEGTVFSGDATVYARWEAVGYVPSTVIPDDIREKVEDKMPLHSGTTPPDIIGQYLANSTVLVGSSRSNDVIGGKYVDRYFAFFMESNGKLSYRDKEEGISEGESDDVIVEVIGNSDKFTAYFIKTGVSSGVSIKESIIISGTLTSSGITDFYYAFVMLEKGPDPDNKVVAVNTYRIFKEDDGLAGRYTWISNNNKLQITFDANGGTVTTASATTGENGRLASLPTPTRSGYAFKGWWTVSTATGGDSVTVNRVYTANTTIYARWTAEPVTPPSGGTFTDSRDSKTYKKIVIGTQTWMAENLNYDVPSNTTDVCYENSAANCAKYGRLYNWSTAMTACPVGWRLPSDAEWTKLTDFVGGSSTAGKKLKSTSGWNGTDDYGFAALPAGNGYSDGSFYNAGNIGNWWSATENDAYYAWYRNMYYNYEDVGRDDRDKALLFSVRCVQD